MESKVILNPSEIEKGKWYPVVQCPGTWAYGELYVLSLGDDRFVVYDEQSASIDQTKLTRNEAGTGYVSKGFDIEEMSEEALTDPIVRALHAGVYDEAERIPEMANSQPKLAVCYGCKFRHDCLGEEQH